MDRNAHSLALGRDLDPITEGEVWIAGIGDQLIWGRAMLAASEFRHGVPLLRRRRQADLPVGRDAFAVQDDLHAPQLLIAEHLVKSVLIGEDAQSLRLEVVARVQMQVGGRQGPAERRKQHEGSSMSHAQAHLPPQDADDAPHGMGFTVADRKR